MERLTFDRAVELFRIYCRSKGLAPRTLETYLFALDGLRTFLASNGQAPALPQTRDLRAYIAYMLDRGLSRGTVRVRMRSIRVFCNFLAREGLVDVSPFEGVEIPRVPEAYPKVLSEAEITKLIKVCKGSSWLDVRNRAILLTFLDTGIRLSELVQLDLADVNLGAFSLRIRRGKGGKERHVFMGRTLFRAMRRWLDARGYTSFQGALFVTRKGTRIDRRNVQRTIERIARRAGLNGTRVTPHLLRHTFATHYIKNGGDPFSLQRILGHSDIKTTMIYVNLAGASLREAHARASPVDRLV